MKLNSVKYPIKAQRVSFWVNYYMGKKDDAFAMMHETFDQSRAMLMSRFSSSSLQTNFYRH